MLAVALACSVGSGAYAAGDISKSTPVQMGNTRMSTADISDFASSLTQEVRNQALADPALMTRLIQLEIIRRAILHEAVARKWQKRPDIVRQVDVARNAIVLKSYLASKAVIPPGYPSEDDIKATYDLNRGSFVTPRQYRLEQIFLQIPADPKKARETEQKAKLLAKSARGGARFEDLARQNSQHKPSAEKGGDMGWAYETQILPEIRNVVAGMRRNEVSDPIRSNVGWHIIKMLETKPASVRPLSEVRPLIVADLRQRKEQATEQLFIVQMLQKTPVKANYAELRNIFRAAQ